MITKRDRGAKEITGIGTRSEFDVGWWIGFADETEVWIDIENTDDCILTPLGIAITKEVHRRLRELRQKEHRCNLYEFNLYPTTTGDTEHGGRAE